MALTLLLSMTGLLFCCGENRLNAPETGSPIIRNFSPGEYGGHRRNWSILQDKRGIMYIGNGNCLLEFDGNNWRRIEIPNFSFVRSLDIDKNGTIYAGAFNEFGYLAAGKNGEMKYISLSRDLPAEHRHFDDIWDTAVTTHGIYFRARHKTFRYFRNKIEVIPITTLSKYTSLYDALLVMVKNKGIFLLKNGKLQPLPFTRELTGNSAGPVIILPYNSKKILAAPRGKGFYLYDLGEFLKNGEFIPDISAIDGHPSMLKKFPTEIDDYILKNHLITGEKLDRDRYAFGTKFGGIIIMNRNGRFKRVVDKNRGLRNNTVRDLFPDHQGNLWAVLNNGISVIDINSPISVIQESTGASDYITAVIHYQDKLFVCTLKGLFYLRGRAAGPNGKNSFLPVPGCHQNYRGITGFKNTLVAGGINIVAHIDGTRATVKKTEEVILCFGQSPRFPNHIFAGCWYGLSLLEIKSYGNSIRNQEIKLHISREGRFKNIKNIIRSIASDQNGDLWLSTNFNGILYLKFNGDDIGDFQIHHYQKKHGLPRLDWNRVYFIDNRMIVTTPAGIYRAVFPGDFNANPGALRFEPDDRFGTMFADGSVGVSGCVISPEKKIWVNSTKGAGILSPNADGTYWWNPIPLKKIGDADLLYLDEQGIAWIEDHDGFFRFDPGIYKDYRKPYNALIRKVTVSNKSVIFNGAYYDPGSKFNDRYTVSALRQPKCMIRELDYRGNSITFEYSAVFYENREKNRYKYFLEGYDKNWSDWTGISRKEYTNLHEGSYRFRIKAKNIFEVESKEAVYEFKILPPLHRTPIAYIIYTLIFIAVVISAVRFHLFRVKKMILKERKSYELEPEIIDDYVKRIRLHMETVKPYLDPNFMISMLSDAVSIPVYHISHTINNRFQKNFNEFINSYRIDEAKRKLSEPGQHRTPILDIAYEVGFNSKSTFNNAFKKNTNMTPTQYKKTHKKKTHYGTGNKQNK